jgi:lipid II:glycine glycyltransferase (peptidoglycan interpeptide bridge formation enzyme)
MYLEISRRRISKYAYLPNNPVLNINKYRPDLVFDATDIYTEFLKDLKKFGKKYVREKSLNLFKIDPLFEKMYEANLKKAGWKKSLSPGQAKDTWLKNFSLVDGKIDLMKEKKDTRYYIKRAQKAGIIIEKVDSIEKVKLFSDLMNETTSRKGFVNYSHSYFESQWKKLNPEGMTQIWLAKYRDKYIAGALINYFNHTMNYAHGASTSDPELSKLSAPYLLQWKIIEDGVENGFEKYNFWGVLPDNLKDHPWKGLSDFKKKFVGEMISYVGTYEVYSNPIKYYINRLADWWAFRKDRY